MHTMTDVIVCTLKLTSLHAAKQAETAQQKQETALAALSGVRNKNQKLIKQTAIVRFTIPLISHFQRACNVGP